MAATGIMEAMNSRLDLLHANGIKTKAVASLGSGGRYRERDLWRNGKRRTIFAETYGEDRVYHKRLP